MVKRILIAALVGALMLAVVALPVTGVAAPDPFAKVSAAKALRVAKSAKRAARAAKSTANNALTAAQQQQTLTISRVEGAPGIQCADGGGGCQVASSVAVCPSGSVATGGGFEASTPDNVVAFAKAGPNSYNVIATNFFPTGATIKAQVVCTSAPHPAAGRRATSQQLRAELAAKVKDLRAALRAR